MSRIRVCFLGTPAFAEVHLQCLLNDARFEVVGVVSQPDRPAGRNLQLTPSPVKVLAVKNGIEVITPEKLKNEPAEFEKIKSWKADVAVVVAFGQILTQEFLDSFKYGAVNVHGSLLPKWRGAAPIQRSLEAGDKESGVSLQKMVKKLDAGPVIGERRILLPIEMGATELYERMSKLGCELLVNDLVQYIKGELQPVVQDESQVTIAKKIEKSESQLSWNLPASVIHNRVRAFDMGPGTYVMIKEKRLKIHKTYLISGATDKLQPGQIVRVGSSELVIQTGEGQLGLLIVQPESKPRMSIADFVKNLNAKEGDYFV
ncbi:MAG: methionyl-tRNA formyltransferase [Pseudobdellovibrio sp.]|nr:methionyl-tRNA formyltransferase [Pseudobdellovibrio sp.]